MPELPEVETMVRGLAPFATGMTIRTLEFLESEYRPLATTPRPEEMSAAVQGTTICSVRRVAKRIVLDLSNEHVLFIEPRMTGLIVVSDPPNEHHLRIAFHLVHGRRPSRFWLWDRRGLSVVKLVSQETFTSWEYSTRIGVDALQMTPELWRQLCGATARPIKVVLLDQQRVAGIGNLYASEILHVAKINPLAPANRLSDPQIARLAAAADSVLNQAIEYEGSTLGDGTYRNVLSQNGRYQNEHRVYAKQGQLCPTCRRLVIMRIVQSQRSTFFCPHCQKLPRNDK